MKGEQFYIIGVNRNWILFDYLTCEYVSNRFILPLNWFVRLRKPKMTVHVKLATIPPMWAKLAPTRPKWPRIVVWTSLK